MSILDLNKELILMIWPETRIVTGINSCRVLNNQLCFARTVLIRVRNTPCAVSPLLFLRRLQSSALHIILCKSSKITNERTFEVLTSLNDTNAARTVALELRGIEIFSKDQYLRQGKTLFPSKRCLHSMWRYIIYFCKPRDKVDVANANARERIKYILV